MVSVPFHRSKNGRFHERRTMHLPIELDEHHASQVLGWLKAGRVAYWPSVDLSNAGGFMLAPSTSARPHWSVASEPEGELSSEQAFEVVSRLEVRRFRVGLRRGSQGFSLKLTDAASRRLRAALTKAGEGSSYHFDYSTQEAVITVRDKCVPLDEWALLQKRGRDAPEVQG
jgi:hypothetical protein